MKRTKDDWITFVQNKPNDMSVDDYCKVNKVGIATYYKYNKIAKQFESKTLVAVSIKEISKSEFISFECNGYNMKIDSNMKDHHLRLILKATR